MDSDMYLNKICAYLRWRLDHTLLCFRRRDGSKVFSQPDISKTVLLYVFREVSYMVSALIWSLSNAFLNTCGVGFSKRLPWRR